MSSAIPIVALAAAIGSALVGGIFHAFSSFVMKALSRVPAAESTRSPARSGSTTSIAGHG